jgi:GTP-binding protein Era
MMNELTKESEEAAAEPFRTGYVAVVGRPNVGKSTLMNRLVGQKVSITSRKAQTTRHQIRGILTQGRRQFVFVDTPGFQTKHQNALNRVMNRAVVQSLQSVDLVLFVIEAGHWGEADKAILKMMPENVPVILVINKVDRLADKNILFPFLQRLSGEREFAALVPVSAAKGQATDQLLKAAGALLPECEPMYDADDITDRSERFLAAEFLREKLFRRLGDELPYGMTVEIEKFEIEGSLRRIHAAIIVDRQAHKAIVIGKAGETLKGVASDARMDMERMFDGKVFLEVWVKVKSGWADDERALKSLGYE